MEYKLHYKKCVYPFCGLTNRKVTDSSISFYKFPINDSDRCITWLINCGLDDWVEMSNSELKNKYLCSRHFSKDSFYASGRLRNNATPKIPNSFYSKENSDSETGTDVEDDDKILSKRKFSDLVQRLIETQAQLQREKNNSNILRSQLRAKCKVINRFKNKLSSGNIDDVCLKKAISQRLSGYSLTLVLVLLFKSRDRKVFTKKEQELFMTMHYTSPSLYNKMRDVLSFNLPHPSTIIRWFGKIDIWPGICQNLFNILKLKSSYMEDIDRNCILIFDEMIIQKCLDFHPRKQIIEGFEDLGSLGRKLAVGTRVLVFMLRGLFTNWKQPLAFFIVNSTIKKHELSIILDEILDALYETNLKVRAVVSDQATSNQSLSAERVCINELFL